MELFSSLLEDLSNLSSWLPYILIAIIIPLMIMVPFFRNGRDKSFIVLVLVLNLSPILFVLFGFSFLSALGFIVPIIINLFSIIYYLNYKQILTKINLSKLIGLSVFYVINFFIFAFIFAGIFGAACGNDEACGFAEIGGFFIGPIVGIGANLILSIIFYRKFLSSEKLSSTNNPNGTRIITFKEIFSSIWFKIATFLIVTAIIISGAFIAWNNYTNKNSNFWKTYSNQYYSFKYPPQGEVEVLKNPGDTANYPDLELKTNTKSDIARDSFDIKIVRVDDPQFYKSLEDYWESNKGYEFIEGTNLDSLKLKYSTLNAYPILLATTDSEHILFIQGKNIILKIDLPFGFTSTEYDVPKVSQEMLLKIAETVKLK